MSSRRNPFEEIERAFERMSRELEDAASQWGAGALEPFGSQSDVAIDLVDEEDAFVVTIDVPGFERDEIDLRLADRTLWIECDRDESTEAAEESYLRQERRHQSVRRSIRLPAPVEPEEVSAKLKNGILTVTVPKAEPKDGSRQIDIEGE